MHSYGMVERALASVFQVSEDNLGKLQARVKNYIRIKFTPTQPGKGVSILYTDENVVQWAVALQLQEYGLEPTQIQKQLSEHWVDIYDFSKNENVENDKIMLFNPALMNDLNREIKFYSIEEFEYSFRNGLRGSICINIGVVGRELRAAFSELAKQDPPRRGRGKAK